MGEVECLERIGGPVSLARVLDRVILAGGIALGEGFGAVAVAVVTLFFKDEATDLLFEGAREGSVALETGIVC